MTSPTYTFRKLPGQAWAVVDPTGRTVAVCDREGEARRVSSVMTREPFNLGFFMIGVGLGLTIQGVISFIFGPAPATSIALFFLGTVTVAISTALHSRSAK